MRWSVDNESHLSLENWMDKYPSLICSDPSYIGMFGMLYFTGYVIGSMFIPTLSDLYGRKKPYLITHVINQICVIIILVLPAISEYYNVVIAMGFVIGVTAAGRWSLGFVYMTEFVPSSYHTFFGTINCTQRGILYLIFSLYFRYINKNWVYLQIFGLAVFLVFFLIVSITIPESPKWLYNKDRFEECNEVMKVMANIN